MPMRKKQHLSRFSNHHKPLRKIVHMISSPIGILTQETRSRLLLWILLMDPDIKIVSLIGSALARGKTLMAIAAGLQQTIGMRSEHNHYSRLIVSRPVQPLGKDIGFLPGTMERENACHGLCQFKITLKFLNGR